MGGMISKGDTTNQPDDLSVPTAPLTDEDRCALIVHNVDKLHDLHLKKIKEANQEALEMYTKALKACHDSEWQKRMLALAQKRAELIQAFERELFQSLQDEQLVNKRRLDMLIFGEVSGDEPQSIKQHEELDLTQQWYNQLSPKKQEGDSQADNWDIGEAMQKDAWSLQNQHEWEIKKLHKTYYEAIKSGKRGLVLDVITRRAFLKAKNAIVKSHKEMAGGCHIKCVGKSAYNHLMVLKHLHQFEENLYQELSKSEDQLSTEVYLLYNECKWFLDEWE